MNNKNLLSVNRKTMGILFSVLFLFVGALQRAQATEIKKLDNGVRVIFISDNSLPRVAFKALVKAGGADDPIGKEGLTSLTADLLEMGTKKYSATQFADRLNGIGAELSISTQAEFCLVGMDSLSQNSLEAFDLFFSALSQPRLAEVEVNRMKQQKIAGLQKRTDNANSVADDGFDEFLFGSQHPYGRLPDGNIQALKTISLRDVKNSYKSLFVPQNSTVLVSGQFDNQFREAVLKRLAQWKGEAGVKRGVLASLPPIASTQWKLISKDGLQQSQIRIGHFGPVRNRKDFITFRILNEVLGGGFSSRLMKRIRTELGLTYGISSQIDAREFAGAFTIETFTKHESLQKTVEETLQVYKKFVEEGITPKELEDAKSQLLGRFPRLIETPEGYASNLMILDYYGIGEDYLTQFSKNVEAVQLNEVNDLIKKEFSAEKIKILIYTDKKKTEEQLKKLSSSLLN